MLATRLHVCRLVCLGLALASAASATIRITFEAKHALGQRVGRLLPGQACELRTGGPRRCIWTVVEGRGLLTPTADGTGAVFTAPPVEHRTTFHVRAAEAEHPEAAALVEIQVRPGAPGLCELLSATLRAKAADQGWMAPPPAASLFAGTAPGLAPDDSPGGGDRLPPGELDFQAMAVQDLPDRPACCLLGGPAGLWEVTRGGEAHRLSEQAVTALAVGPVPARPGGQPRVVFADQAGLRGRVWSLEPDGTTRLLAGGGGLAFGRITGLAIGADQTLYVASLASGRTHGLHRVARDGQVDILSEAGWLPAGEPEAHPRFWGQTSLLTGLALDPEAGCLYVSDRSGIWKVTLDGIATLLLGEPFHPGSLTSGDDLPPGLPCLMYPHGLQVHGGNLFIADPGSHVIRVFDLVTRRLRTLAGDPSQGEARLGPLRLFSPWLPLTACAALRAPEAIALDGEGTLLVAQTTGVFQLDLGPLAGAPPPAQAQRLAAR